MKVKKLKELIKDLPDGMEVCTFGSDHSYSRCNVAHVATAEVAGGDYYEEDPDDDSGEKEQILIVGIW